MASSCILRYSHGFQIMALRINPPLGMLQCSCFRVIFGIPYAAALVAMGFCIRTLGLRRRMYRHVHRSCLLAMAAM